MKLSHLVLGAALAVSPAFAQHTTVNGQPVPARNLHQLQHIPANYPVMPRRAAQVRARIPVKQINVVNGVAHLRGSVRGLGMDVYQFNANAGDRVVVTSNPPRAMEFAIFLPAAGTLFANGVVLPESGVYELRIVNNRKRAHRTKRAYPYNVKFTLTR